jgi:uncharacterized protein YrrD
MRRVSELVGLPVVSFETGRKLASVEDILVDPERNAAVALLVEEGGWFADARVVPWDGVQSVGRDAIIVPSARAVLRAGRHPAARRALRSGIVVTWLRVLSDDGRDLGTITDVALDERTGAIVGFEVSGGMLQDVQRGKRFVPGTARIGRQVAFIAPEVSDRVEAEVRGGIAAGVQAVQASTTEALERARARSTESLERVRSDVARASAQATTWTAERQREFVVGKTASRPVVAADGTALVQAGEVVTSDQALRAEQAGRLGDLVLAVGGAPMAELGPRARERGRQLQSELRQAWEDVSATLRRWWSRLQRSNETARVRHALGRPVTRVILDRDDRVILNAGDLITHRAVEEARQAGVLEVLLSSVATRTPALEQLTIAREAAFAAQPGRASLSEAARQPRAAERVTTVEEVEERRPTEAERLRGRS